MGGGGPRGPGGGVRRPCAGVPRSPAVPVGSPRPGAGAWGAVTKAPMCGEGQAEAAAGRGS